MHRAHWCCYQFSLLVLLSILGQPQILPLQSPSATGVCPGAGSTPPHRSVPSREPANPANIVQEGSKVIVTCASPAAPDPDRLHDLLTLLASWPIIALIAGIVWSRSISRLLQVIADRLARGGGLDIAGVISIPPEDVGSSRDVMGAPK